MTNIQEIKQKLINAKEAYYNEEPIMSDSEFDALEDKLRGLSPNDEYFKIVGSPIEAFSKVKHEVPMLSMEKIKEPKDIIPWLEKNALTFDDIYIGAKIDGLSCTAKYISGKLVYLATRGDGKEGRDVTHLINFVKIPKQFDHSFNIEVRGELCLFKDCKIDGSNNKPLRNIAVGLVNRKDNFEDQKHLHFIAYKIIGNVSDFKTDVADALFLSVMGFETLNDCTYSLIDKIKSYQDFEMIYHNYLTEYRNLYLFETDGLVISVKDQIKQMEIDSLHEVSHHHFYNIALKPPAEAKQTILRSIEWNTTRTGAVVPVAIFDEVIIGDSSISRATLHNYSNVIKHGLHIGDSILIEKANEVIPFFAKNLTEHYNSDKIVGENIVPKYCPSCYHELVEDLNNTHLMCNNPNCEAKSIAKVLHWVQNAEMDQISEKTIEMLFVEDIIKNIRDFYNITPDKLTGIIGLGDKKIDNIMTNIAKTRVMNIGQFLKCLGIRGLGNRSIKKLNITKMSDFMDYKVDDSVLSQDICKWLNENREFLNELLEVVTVIDENRQISYESNIISNKQKVCMTGSGPKSRKELISIIESKGYEFTESVNKETNILICEDVNKSSSKLEKARKLGIQLMKYSEFFGE